MADKKISELVSITGANTAADDYFVVVDTSGAVTYKISREELNNAIEQDVLSSIEITDITNDVNVQGTVTADGLTVSAGDQIQYGGTAFDYIAHDSSNNAGIINHRNNIKVNVDSNNDSSTDGYFGVGRDGTDASSTDMFRIAQNGDISFYDSTGVTQGFFWDASTQYLGLGTTAPNDRLTVKTDGNTRIEIGSAGTGAGSRILSYDRTGAASQPLKAAGSIFTVNTGVGGGSERMRIDSSGNLLVGKTSSSATTQGIEARADGRLWVSTSSDDSIFNRAGTDGGILSFRKSGTVVGSIGSTNFNGSKPFIANPQTNGAGLGFYTNAIFPTNSSGAPSDGAVDLGIATYYKFKDLHLSGGVYLGGTGAANKLDDYEEGTWTPVWLRSSSNPSWSSATQIGYYTKVGNLVTITWYFLTNTITSNGSGAWRIGGLPFTASDESYASIGRFYNGGEVTGTRAYALNGNTLINYMVISTDNGYDATPGGYTILQGTLSYFA